MVLHLVELIGKVRRFYQAYEPERNCTFFLLIITTHHTAHPRLAGFIRYISGILLR